MSKSLFSQHWYRVAPLKPRLRSHADIHRQQFRGQTWYVLQDHVTGKFHRFSPAAYLIIGMMDGSRTVEEIWEGAARKLGDDLPTQDEMVNLLGQLHSADVLHTDIPPDFAEIAYRSGKQRRSKLLQSFKNPMAMRLPLIDPDKFLAATLPVVGPLFSRFGFVLWLALVSVGLVLAGIHWGELTRNIADRVFVSENILVMVFSYPIIKALHELGHGYAVKRWGGEVHEMGVMFLVLMPVPYVDASAATAFRDKWKRAAVGAAGIMVEVSIACLALVVWLAAEPGLIRGVAFNVMLISGVSTALFNGNPLLRFDGYFVMSDIIEIPNLGNRANNYIGYLIKRRLMGVESAETPASAPGEPLWFFCYSITAFVYRTIIFFAIATFVATKFFFIGVLLAFWSVLQIYVIPSVKLLSKLFEDPEVQRKRKRVWGVLAGGAATAVVLIALLPVPYGTVAEGVVWVPERSVVHAGADGIVRRIVAEPGSIVASGDPLIELSDPVLDASVRVLDAEVRELQFRYRAAFAEDRVEAGIVADRLRQARDKLERRRQQQEALTIRSETSGRFLLANFQDLPGNWVRKGSLIAYVVDFERPVLRVVVPDTEIDLVRRSSREVQVRFVEQLDEARAAEVERIVPTAANTLPSRALSVEGGGRIRMDPTDPDRQKSLANLFQMDLKLADPVRIPTVGGRIFVRFDHGYSAIGNQLYRRIRQIFLSRFNV